MKKQYITADQLLADSFELAFQILDSGFRPDIVVGIWRGGTPVAIAVQEVLEYAGIKSDHISIRTSSYTSIGQRTNVTFNGLEYLERHLTSEDKLLLVDDVFDTGNSIDSVINELNEYYRNSPPSIKVATPYFKPANNKTYRTPDYSLHETDAWLVFPHEVIDLSETEICEDKPLPMPIKQRLLNL
jgi:hypoxanthine phosphoribosyltransferase